MTRYEATRSFAPTATSGYRQERDEFDTKAEAIAYAEAAGDAGSVITWHVYPNLPGCLPAMRYSSCALDVFEGGAWRGVNIFG